MHVREYHSLDAVSELRGLWESLLRQTPQATFFQSLEWLTVHWRHVGGDGRLRVLAVFEGEEPVGLLPLLVKQEASKVGSLRVAGFPTDGWSSFYGPIGHDPAGLLRICCEHLQRSPGDHDLLDLKGLRLPESPLVIEGATFTEHGGVALIELSHDWETYWESRRQHHNRRRNVERCERRLAEQGELKYVRHRPRGTAHGDDDPRWDLYEACVALACKSWQSGLTDGNTLCHEGVRQFLREAHAAAARQGALDLNLLYLRDRPVAFIYGYHYRGYVDLIRVGFDPELAKLAPGNALWTRLIRDSFARGDRVLDLGPTCLDYKEFWLTRVEPAHRLTRYPLTPRAQVLRMARWLRGRLTHPADPTNQAAKEAVAARRSEADVEQPLEPSKA